MNRLTVFFILSCSCLCFSADLSGGSKFRLSIGAGGAFLYSIFYWDQFGSTGSNQYIGGAVYPSLNIGAAISPRFSLFMHYTHYLVYREQFDSKIRQLSYLAAGSTVFPSKKFSNGYLSFSLGYLQYWRPIDNYESVQWDASSWYYGLAATEAVGYRINNHFRVQLDMDYLLYRWSATINQTTILPGDNSNTIVNLGKKTYSDNWMNIVVGISAYWDIF